MKPFKILLLVFLLLHIGCQNDDDDDNDISDDDNSTDDDTIDDDTSDDDSSDDDTTDDDTYDGGDLIENSGFETGAIDPWFGNWAGEILCDSSTCQPHDGSYSAWLGNCSNCTETLEQIITLPNEISGYQIHYWLKVFKQENPAGSLHVDLLNETGDVLIANLEQIEIENFTETGEWYHHNVHFPLDVFYSHLGENLRFRFKIEVIGTKSPMASVQIDEVHFIWSGY